MKLTQVLLSKNEQVRIFRCLWELRRHRSVKDLGYAKYCEEAKIPVVKSADYLHVYDVGKPKPIPAPIIVRESRERVVHPPLEERIYVGQQTNFMAGLPQTQTLANCVIFHHLPDYLQEEIHAPLVSQDVEDCQNAFSEAHLLDAYQLRLVDTRTKLQIKKNCYTPPYGIPITRRSELLLSNYFTMLDANKTPKDLKNYLLLKNSFGQVSVNHGERELLLNFDAAYLSLKKDMLPPILQMDEISVFDSVKMPDLFPQNPYVMYTSDENTDPQNHCCISGSSLVPHTVYFLNPCPKYWLSTDDSYTSTSMMAALCFAVSYAKRIHGEDLVGDLPSPITLQLVHLGERYAQVSVFQLNTLALTGARKNAFWYEPRISLYDTCEFKAASPAIEGHTADLFKMVKAFHMSSGM